MARPPKNHRASWTATETKTLKRLVKERTPAEKIAKEFGRSTAAVRQRASIEGISFRVPKKRSARAG
jgi:hypothetical protein